MGCDPAHNAGATCWERALPLHLVYLDSFWIDKYEVTNAEYARCVAEGLCKEPAQYSSKTRPDYYDNPEFVNFPVINIGWQDASNYCNWAGKRLPSEA